LAGVVKQEEGGGRKTKRREGVRDPGIVGLARKEKGKKEVGEETNKREKGRENQKSKGKEKEERGWGGGKQWDRDRNERRRREWGEGS